MDGTMVPTVQSDASQRDQRKGKSVQWQEAKVSLAHVQGSKELVYAATLTGDVDAAGKQLRACAKRAGFGKGHRVHGVGDKQKDRLKTQGLGPLLNELQAHLERPEMAQDVAPVRQCWRYLSQRQDQLDYEGAISQGLPIGSGEIESAHRYLIQKRLKLPGSWWKAANAQHMLSLRVNRANGEWPAYWATNYRYAA